MPLTVFPAGIVKGIVAIKLKLPATPLTGSMSSVNFCTRVANLMVPPGPRSVKP